MQTSGKTASDKTEATVAFVDPLETNAFLGSDFFCDPEETIFVCESVPEHFSAISVSQSIKFGLRKIEEKEKKSVAGLFACRFNFPVYFCFDCTDVRRRMNAGWCARLDGTSDDL